MKTVLTHLISWFMVGVLPLMAQSSTKSAFPTDAQIRDLLVERIDKQHQSVGIVVGIVDSTGRRTISYGKFDTGAYIPPATRHNVTNNGTQILEYVWLVAATNEAK